MKKRYWLLLTVIFVVCDSVFFLIYFKEEPPLNEITEARLVIKEAKKIKSRTYSEFFYNRAISYYDSAMIEWQTQNRQFYFFRNYEKAKKYASMADQAAKSAIENTQNASQNISKIVSEQISYLDEKVGYFENNFKKLPLEESKRTEWNKGAILLNEGKMAFENEDYLKSLQKTEKARGYLLPVISHNEQLLEGYFLDYSNWKKWVKESIKNSKKHKTNCLIVDKFSRECALYKSGKLHSAYDIELGKNWIGDKNYQGDKSTPEGSYKITRKLERGETKYHKALLLNYPNEEDKKRFEENKANGELSKNAKIGGLIEIHGHGGKGIDWTDGCIALEDADMDKLFPFCKNGMEVVIVGSLKPLGEIIKKE